MSQDRLLQVFKSVFNDPEFQIDDQMTADDYEAWDSLSHINLIIAVEKEFQCRFKNAEIARLKNVGDLRKLIEKYTS